MLNFIRSYNNVLCVIMILTVVVLNFTALNLATAQQPVAEYRFDEFFYTEATGEVIDSSSNANHATVIGDLTTTNGLLCNAVNIPPSNVDSPLQVIETGINLTNLPAGTISMWYKSNTAWNDGTRKFLFGATANSRYFYGFIESDGRIKFYWENGTDGDHQKRTQVAFTTQAGVWKHLSFAWNSTTRVTRIVVDGVNMSLSGQTGNGNTAFNRNRFIGIGMRSEQSQGLTADGLLDEVLVYDQVLSTSKVQTIYNNHLAGNDYDGSARVCPVPDFHHLEIIHDGQGLTCESETVTVRACLDQACTMLYDQPVSVDFLVNGTTVSSPTFTGTTSVTFDNTSEQTVSLSLVNMSTTTYDPFSCFDGSASSCDMTFTNAGFRFLYGAGSTIANQTAGAEFADTLQLQAVKDTNGVCTGLFNGNINVELSQENVAPSGVNGLSFSTDGTPIAKHPGTSSTLLSFGADSIASLTTPVYNDAGQIRLHANYDVGDVILSGSSNLFWVAPAYLDVNAQTSTNSIDGASPTSAVTHPAGEDFSINISAFNAATPPAITQNYEHGQMQFKLTRTAPTLAASVDGLFTYGLSHSISSSATPNFKDVNLSAFVNGVYEYTGARYSEVGLLSLDIQDINYGNENILVSANDINIGRFIPDYFTQTVAQHGVLQSTCGSNISFNAFSGQKSESDANKGSISYLTAPVLAITAYNKQGNVTQNYYEDSSGSANDFMHLSSNNVIIDPPSADQVATGIDSTLLPINANMDTGILSQNDESALPSIVPLPRGTLHYVLSSNDHFFYERSANAKVNPFMADIDFSVSSIIDNDNVSATSTNSASPTGVDVRFGRLTLENNFGPETNNITIPMKLEHFKDNSFITSVDNNCVNYNSNNMSLVEMDLDINTTSKNTVAGRFLSGISHTIELTSPGAGNVGNVGVVYDTYEWLQYDWNNSGALTENPSAIITFGIYRGDDRLFHWRESF